MRYLTRPRQAAPYKMVETVAVAKYVRLFFFWRGFWSGEIMKIVASTKKFESKAEIFLKTVEVTGLHGSR